MLITFKTLQQKIFKIEIEETEKIKCLKEKVAAERGDEFPINGQKLIYAGKILDDEATIGSYNIDPVKGFVVVMAVKPKSKAATQPEATSTTTSQSSSSSSTSTDASTTSTPSTTTASASATSAESTTTSRSEQDSTTATTASTDSTSMDTAQSAFLAEGNLEESITNLMSLGYSRNQVLRALNSSYHNADRAAEYLLSGTIPDTPLETTTTSDDSETAPASESSPGTVADLNFLRSLPQFQLMRSQVQAHPETLPTLLQEIGRANPELLQLISRNQTEFIRLLNEPISGDDAEGETGDNVAGGAGGGGAFQLQVTPEEKSAIDRIVAMGFSEADVVQAFFACEKNEQLAINFLLGGN